MLFFDCCVLLSCDPPSSECFRSSIPQLPTLLSTAKSTAAEEMDAGNDETFLSIKVHPVLIDSSVVILLNEDDADVGAGDELVEEDIERVRSRDVS